MRNKNFANKKAKFILVPEDVNGDFNGI